VLRLDTHLPPRVLGLRLWDVGGPFLPPEFLVFIKDSTFSTPNTSSTHDRK
jgi:hypothetical protein